MRALSGAALPGAAATHAGARPGEGAVDPLGEPGTASYRNPPPIPRPHFA